MTIEITDEIRRAYSEAWFRTIGLDDEDAVKMATAEVADPMPWRDAALAAVLAIVERDYEPKRCDDPAWTGHRCTKPRGHDGGHQHKFSGVV